MTTRTSTQRRGAHRPTARRAILLASAALGAAALTSPIGPAHASPGPPTYTPVAMTISPASGPIGTRVSVVGTCHPGAKVPWFFGVPNSDGGPGIVRGDVTAASTGRFTITFTVPPDVDPKLPSVVGAYCADADPDPSTPIVEAQDNFTITTATAVVTNPPSPDHPVAATPHFTG